nr:hypothetical protein [Tanacetum cinerariifolium]
MLSHLITSSTTTSRIFVEVPQLASIQLLSPRRRQQIMGTSSGLKTWCLRQCGFKNRQATTSMLSRESLIGGTNVNSSTILLSTGNLLAMSTLSVESSLLLKSRLSSGIITSTWIRSRSIVIQRRVEDLQLGVESYQKKLNLTRPDTYRFDLKCKEVYTPYSNPRGFIYQNKDKHNRLMRIDELHKFSDGMLTDVRTALDDCVKGIRMKYLS